MFHTCVYLCLYRAEKARRNNLRITFHKLLVIFCTPYLSLAISWNKAGFEEERIHAPYLAVPYLCIERCRIKRMFPLKNLVLPW